MKNIQFERLALFVVGLIFLVFAMLKVNDDKVAEAGGVALIAVMCFVFANLTRFKKFKGLGFEGELWEEKQQEAENLIERLKSVVSIYTQEIIRGTVQQGRFADGKRWQKVWPLYDQLTARHEELGQQIDFSGLKRELDTYFLFDMCMNVKGFNQALFNAQSAANDKLKKEFGSVVTDQDRFGERLAQLRSITFWIADPFAIAQQGNLARKMLSVAEETAASLKEHFDVELLLAEPDKEKLLFIATTWDNRPVPVTDQLISLADRSQEE